MQKIIERLSIAAGVLEKQSEAEGLSLEHQATIIAASQELSAISEELKTLDQEHTNQTNELRALREDTQDVTLTVANYRRKYNIYQDEISSLGEDVTALLDELSRLMTAAVDDAAALRGVLEGIRDTARKAQNEYGDFTEPHKHIFIRDLLGSVAHRAVEGLKSHNSGAALRKDIRQLESVVDQFEKSMRETGGWTYSSDRLLAERTQRCIDHYTRMAAQAVRDSHSFKDDVVSWLRGISISAQSVSWASTHHEKDARLRGLIEVVETSIGKINELRFNDRLSSWNGVVDSWMRSDFPTREMRRRIFDLEQEVERLQKNGRENQGVAVSTHDDLGEF